MQTAAGPRAFSGRIFTGGIFFPKGSTSNGVSFSGALLCHAVSLRCRRRHCKKQSENCSFRNRSAGSMDDVTAVSQNSAKSEKLQQLRLPQLILLTPGSKTRQSDKHPPDPPPPPPLQKFLQSICEGLRMLKQPSLKFTSVCRRRKPRRNKLGGGKKTQKWRKPERPDEETESHRAGTPDTAWF